MPGQFNTIRDEKTGQLRKTTPEERERLQFSNITPPPPAAGSVTQQDVDFVNNGAEPPPLPDVSQAEPPPLPPRAPPVQQPPQPEEEEESSGIGGAVQGAITGSKAGVVGAVVGAGVGFLAGRKSKPPPIGTLEGAVGGQDSGLGDTMRQLLAVQQGIARLGSPVKDAITTDAPNSRM